MQTVTAAKSTRTSCTQVPRPQLQDTGTDMPLIQTKTAESQVGCYFDIEVIPPGALRPQLPRAHSYAQFDQLLQAYPEVHPEDFVTFGVLQEQPRRGSHRKWGEVAGVLAHMIGGRHTLVTELITIINGIQRLDRTAPMRAAEELALVAVLIRERCRSRVPLGEGPFKLLAAPDGPMARPTTSDPSGAQRDPRRHPPPPSSTSEPQPGPSGAQGRPGRPPSPQPGPSGTQGGRQRPEPPPGPSGAQGGPRRPPPGFETVDLTADADTEDEEMIDAPASPSPHVSDMKTDEEADLLAYPGSNSSDDSSDDGFQHV